MGRIAKSLTVTGGLVIIILLTLVWNTGIETSQGVKPTVVVSFFPLYDWTKNIVGDRMIVRNLTPPGMDPHDLDPTPQDLSVIVSSSVFIYSGTGMEAWVEKVLPTMDKSHTVIVDATLGVDIMYGASGFPDPHFWLDPLAAITAVENIELGLVQADPANSVYYREHAQNYIDRLETLHRAFIGNLSSVRIRTFITFHEAFGYWAKTYNITEVGIYGFEPEGEPSAAHMQDLVNLAKRYRITTVLASNLDDPHWCQVLADQIGGHVLVLDPLEGPTVEQDRDGNYGYIGRSYYNIGILKEALT